MSILYDSKKRQVQPWIPIFFLLVPLLVIGLGYFLTKDKVQAHKSEKDQKQTEDVFQQF